ncbi:uncharacterized protein LOC120839760 [Ixodes scapularis]|uniref:uncharacterized protein LOC120839760 n=1 Tax=Ixodes scapularis TaxID=6945 RepID=UPI001A9E9699|nr:uncharacterized protein LOC120839760 [Ixodes scapularis]
MDEFEGEKAASAATVTVSETPREGTAVDTASVEKTPEPSASVPTVQATPGVFEDVVHEKAEKPVGPGANARTEEDDGKVIGGGNAKARDGDNAKGTDDTNTEVAATPEPRATTAPKRKTKEPTARTTMAAGPWRSRPGRLKGGTTK